LEANRQWYASKIPDSPTDQYEVYVLFWGFFFRQNKPTVPPFLRMNYGRVAMKRRKKKRRTKRMKIMIQTR